MNAIQTIEPETHVDVSGDQPPPTVPTEFVAGGDLKAMIPQNAKEYGRLADLLIQAHCVPAGYEENGRGSPPSRAKLIIGLMKSVEIGVPPLTGINGIMIVNNRPSVWGDLAVALIQRTGTLEAMHVRRIGPPPQPDSDLTEWNSEYGWFVSMKRRGQDTPYIGEFTVGQAKRAQLWLNHKKDIWIKYPDRMLFNRARAFPSRDGFADCLHGMAIIEEMMGAVDEAPRRIATSFLDDEPVTEAADAPQDSAEEVAREAPAQ